MEVVSSEACVECGVRIADVALRKLELKPPGPFGFEDPGAARCWLLPLPPRTRADAGYAFGDVVEALGMVGNCHPQDRVGSSSFSVTDHGDRCGKLERLALEVCGGEEGVDEAQRAG